MLSASQNGTTVAFTWDSLGRQLTQTLPIASVASPVFTSDYDLAGRRTRLTWPVDASGPTAYHVDYDYLVTGEVVKIREKGATSGAGVLATYGYDDLGRRSSIVRGNGASTGYQYDDVSRLRQLSHDFAGTAHDLILDFAYNPASQIVGRTASNSAYAWTGHGSGSTASTADGLNRLAGHGGATPTYDARGNITFDGVYSYAYSSENLLTSFATSGTLEYDPLMRFYRNYSTYFIHDGPTGQFLGEYYNGNIVGRYVPGPDTDEALAVIDKFGNRTWLHADERGSVIASSGATGANSRIVQFDEYGKRGSGGSLRFAYTGQFHLLGDVYDYKNRNYNARLGRFLQADPIGYLGGMNQYIYVGGDPVNFRDPLGLCGFGQFPLATPRTNRPPGDVVALYFFTCMELFSDDGFSGDVGDSEGVGGQDDGQPDESRDQPLCLATPPSIPQSAETTSRAVNQALREVYGRGAGPMSSPLSSEFARLQALPDFSREGWQQSESPHAGYAWELPIPSMQGHVVKVYLNDRDLGGLTTVAITSPTKTIGHYVEYVINVGTGNVGNAERAVKYLRMKQPCK